MKWEELFAPHILTRGYDYFCDGAVENIEVAEDCVRANVSGTEEYENVLKKDYPERLLIKYETEVNKMATYTSDRKNYRAVEDEI